MKEHNHHSNDEDIPNFPGTESEKKRFLKIACLCATLAMGAGVLIYINNRGEKCERHRLAEDDPEGLKKWILALRLREKNKISENLPLPDDHPAFD